MSTLTSKVQALLTYANGISGKADTTLGDAVKSLGDGFGGGGGMDFVGVATTIPNDTYGILSFPQFGTEGFHIYIATGNGVVSNSSTRTPSTFLIIVNNPSIDNLVSAHIIILYTNYTTSQRYGIFSNITDIDNYSYQIVGTMNMRFYTSTTYNLYKII